MILLKQILSIMEPIIPLLTKTFKDSFVKKFKDVILIKIIYQKIRKQFSESFGYSFY